MKTGLIIFTAVILASLLFWQCQRTTYTKSDFPEKRLSFGSGGGFTGAVTAYHLLPNGQIFKSKGLQADTSHLFTIKKKEALAFFNQAEESNLMNEGFNHPGNIYHFVNYYTDEGENKVVWGAHEVEVPAQIQKLHDGLNDLIKNQSSE